MNLQQKTVQLTAIFTFLQIVTLVSVIFFIYKLHGHVVAILGRFQILKFNLCGFINNDYNDVLIMP